MAGWVGRSVGGVEVGHGLLGPRVGVWLGGWVGG